MDRLTREVYFYLGLRITLTLLLIVLLSVDTELMAQCPMCKTAAESNLKNGGTAGTGLNAGILYMLSMPYVLLMTLGYLWFQHKKRKATEQTMGEV